ncbi:maestro heat-like repeat family member 5 [Fukomys damarensis]|uniref:maestro heat-like repeat family member 5 n=1 Tax=Fukomys damarensis TaxID=885580 RepID=UPI0005402610|nr:maestro heat-like repeat family member 5 [Fukomys damarensis]
MSATEQDLALGIICHYLEGYSQHLGQENAMDTDISMQKLLESLSLAPEQVKKKTLLFRLFGLILRECTSVALVKSHLARLLELSHQDSSQREDIALAVGLTSTMHLEEVWTLLEHMGSTWFLRWRKLSPEGQDDVLKASFLSAAVLLTRVLRYDYGVQKYKYTQIPEFIQCLLCILQEPNFLATLFRQKIILVIVGLSNLRPSLQPWVKSKVLEVCLRSVYVLPPTEELPSNWPSLDPSPVIDMLYRKTVRALDLLLQSFFSENPSMDEACFLLQHLEHWLQSDKSHERQRAVRSILLLLKYVVDTLNSTEEAMPSALGRQLGLLTLLWWDRDAETQSPAHQCVYLLLQLSVQQKGRMTGLYQSKAKCFKVRTSGKGEAELQHLVKAFDKVLSVAQHTQLVLTLLHSLRCCSLLQSRLASKLLLWIFQGPGIKLEQVAEVLHGLFQELPSIHFKKAQEAMMKAMMALGTQHTLEVTEVLLSLCHPSERQTLTLWMALAANCQLARKVMTLLYMKLKLRPTGEVIQPTHQVQLISLLALDTIYELLYTQEYRTTVRWAFAGILLGLLTQLHYLLEMDMVEGFLDYQEDILDSKPLGPCRTCLEALKGLFWTTQYWEVFAHVKLLRGWELFEHLETYTEGVTLLARAMALYDCEVKAVLGQAIISLKSTETRDNIMAILIIAEFLNSPEVSKHVDQRAMNSLLSLGLNSPNWLVRAMSLKGLSSTLMNPKKERAEVRGNAIFLFGDVIHSRGRKFQQLLKNLAFQALVPLLVHLADSCQEVVMRTKFTFFRCAILLKWEFQKELFSKLTWGQGLGAEYNIFMYMVESNFGSHHQFLMQALTYLRSRHRNLKLAAMKFIGGMLQEYFLDLCLRLKKSDTKTLKKYFDALQEDPDDLCRRFYLSFSGDIMELSHYVA